MRKFLTLALAFTFVGLSLSACTKKEATTEVTTTTTTTTDGKVGIAECDEYIEKIQKCFAEKVPADQKGMLETGYKQMVTTWKGMAPDQKTGLAAACKTALESAKTTYQAFGCEL